MTIMIFSFAISSSASSLSSEETLEKALKELVEGDINAYINYVVDNRFESFEIQKEEYSKMFSENPLVDFKILKSAETIDKNTQTVEFYFKNGEVTEVQFSMGKIDEQWKLIIGDLAPEQNKIIIEGTDQNSEDEEYSTNGVSICNYSFWSRVDRKNFYSNCTFTPPSNSLILGVTNQFVSTGPPTVKNQRITYAVVNNGLFGDTVYGEKTLYGTVHNQRYSLKLDGGAGKKGLQIRFSPYTDSSGVKWDGRGSLEY